MGDSATLGGGARVYYRACVESLGDAERARCLPVLDDSERARMARFRFGRDRDLYLQAHVLVRKVLAHHSGEPPESFRFEAGPHGRPEIVHPVAGCRLRFNLSHTSGLAACAVAVGRDVGVDAEYRERSVDIDALSPRVLSPAERAAFEALPEVRRRHRFFEHWTLKEAYIKAVGVGMSLPLRGITTVPGAPLPGSPDEHGAGLRLEGIDDRAERYQLRLHSVGEAHQLAVVVAAGADGLIDFVRWK